MISGKSGSLAASRANPAFLPVSSWLLLAVACLWLLAPGSPGLGWRTPWSKWSERPAVELPRVPVVGTRPVLPAGLGEVKETNRPEAARHQGLEGTGARGRGWLQKEEVPAKLAD